VSLYALSAGKPRIRIKYNKMEEIRKTIDIEKAVKNGDSRFLKSLPRFAIKLIIKIVEEEEFNRVINDNREKIGVHFINGILHDLNVNVEIIDGENIPSTGRFIFVANHPVGGMDALSFYSAIHRFYKDIMSPANQLLNIIPNLRPLVLGLNVFGKTNKETALKLNALFESDTQIITFPAGEVSRRKKGIIKDIDWQKSFITKAIQYKRDIVPLHISGRNSNLFYFVANLRKSLGIKMYVESILLPREMLKQKNSTMTLQIGKPLSYQTFTDKMTHSEWAEEVKKIVYSIPSGKH
jgi:putative hemolysin